MGDTDRFMAALRDDAVPMCDDCITLAVGWAERQRANVVGRKLANVGDIQRAKGTCCRCGRVKTVSWPGDTQRYPDPVPLDLPKEATRLDPGTGRGTSRLSWLATWLLRATSCARSSTLLPRQLGWTSSLSAALRRFG